MCFVLKMIISFNFLLICHAKPLLLAVIYLIIFCLATVIKARGATVTFSSPPITPSPAHFPSYCPFTHRSTRKDKYISATGVSHGARGYWMLHFLVLNIQEALNIQIKLLSFSCFILWIDLLRRRIRFPYQLGIGSPFIIWSMLAFYITSQCRINWVIQLGTILYNTSQFLWWAPYSTCNFSI